jgi:hypothetical protein
MFHHLQEPRTASNHFRPNLSEEGGNGLQKYERRADIKILKWVLFLFLASTSTASGACLWHI